MTSLWTENNYNFKEKKIGFEGYCKWKQLSLFLLSLKLHFVLIPMSLIMQEPGRCLCQRAKPYALSWKPWDFFFHPCTQTSSSLTYVFWALLSCVWMSMKYNCWPKNGTLKAREMMSHLQSPCLLHHRVLIPWK